MTDKNLDLIVANDLGQEGAGFNHETNIVSLLYKDGSVENLPLMSKDELSHQILNRIRKFRKNKLPLSKVDSLLLSPGRFIYDPAFNFL
jgi:hypothetical protein